jgi:hypothetical protein
MFEKIGALRKMIVCLGVDEAGEGLYLHHCFWFHARGFHAQHDKTIGLAHGAQ